MTIEVGALIAIQTAAQFLDAGLELAATYGLPVTTWRVGDPTRTLYAFLAESLAGRERLAGQIKAAQRKARA